MKQRLQKFLASCGIGSRRKCEEYIKQGRVSVNGDVSSQMGVVVDVGNDDVRFDGKKVESEKLVYWALNKPVGVLCSSKSDKKHKLVIDFVPHSKQRLYSVGRLDVNSEGLIFLTNDGGFCHSIAHPSFGLIKTYTVWLDSVLSVEDRKRIQSGIVIDRKYLTKAKIKKVVSQSNGCKVFLELFEGRNREIRKIFSHLGKKVIRLRRIKIGLVQLGNLKSGEYRPILESEINLLQSKSGDSHG